MPYFAPNHKTIAAEGRAFHPLKADRFSISLLEFHYSRRRNE